MTFDWFDWLTDVRHASYKQGGACETAEIPEISELRCGDPEIHGRRVWEIFHHINYHKRYQSHFIIRFGSGAEVAIFSTLYILTLFDLVAVPFSLSFDIYDVLSCYRAVAVVEFTSTFVYAIGVASGLRTSFIHDLHSSECMEAHEIRHHLFSRWQTWADVVSILALPVSYIPSVSTVGGLLRLCKCWRLPHDPKRQMLLYFAQHAEQARMVQIMLSRSLYIILLAHLYACVWFSARAYSSPQQWAVTPDLCGGQVAVQAWESLTPGEVALCYMYSLHDGVSMLTGWGNPDALHMLETSCQIVIALLNGCMMAYVYGLFVAAISFASISEDRFSEQTAILQSACDNMHLPKGLRFRVCRYHSYLSTHHMGRESQELLDSLSANLRSELQVFRMRDVLTSAHFFKGVQPRLSVLLLAACTEQVFSPGDMVIRKGELGDCMYIILRGVTGVLIDDAATALVSLLRKNQCFGEASLLLSRCVRTAWVRTETFTVLSQLARERFEACLDDELRQSILQRIAAHLQRQDKNNTNFLRQQTNQSLEETARRLTVETYASSSSFESSDSDSWLPVTHQKAITRRNSELQKPLLGELKSYDGDLDDAPKQIVSQYASVTQEKGMLSSLGQEKAAEDADVPVQNAEDDSKAVIAENVGKQPATLQPAIADSIEAEAKALEILVPKRRKSLRRASTSWRTSPKSDKPMLQRQRRASVQWIDQSALDQESTNLHEELNNFIKDSSTMTVPDQHKAQPNLYASPQGVAELPEALSENSRGKVAAHEISSNLDVVKRLGTLEAQQDCLIEKLTKVFDFFSSSSLGESASGISIERVANQGVNQDRSAQLDSGDEAWLDIAATLKTQESSIEDLKMETRKIQVQLGRIELSSGAASLTELTKELEAHLERIESHTIDALREELNKITAQLGRKELRQDVDALLEDFGEMRAQLGRMEFNPGIVDALKGDTREMSAVQGHITSSPALSASEEKPSGVEAQLGRIESMLLPISDKNEIGCQEESNEIKHQLCRIESMLQSISDTHSRGNQEESSEMKAQLGQIQILLELLSEQKSAHGEGEAKYINFLAQHGRIETTLQPMATTLSSDLSQGPSPLTSERDSLLSSLTSSMVSAASFVPPSMPPSRGMPAPLAGMPSSLGSPGQYKGRSICIKELPQTVDRESSRGRSKAGAKGVPPPRKFVALPTSPSNKCRTPSPGSIGRTGPAKVLSGTRSNTPVLRSSSRPRPSDD